MNEIDRQKKLETDSVQEGILRYCKSREYSQTSDSKPVRNLMADALKPLAQAILEHQLTLKAPGSQKLPRHATAFVSLHHEKEALITLGVLFNAIGQSEFEDGVPPTVTSVANQIGQRCLEERIADCDQKRQVDVARESFTLIRIGPKIIARFTSATN